MSPSSPEGSAGSLAPHGYCFRCGTSLEPRLQEEVLRPTCPRCGFIHYLDPKVAVAVVLGDGGRLLLGRRNIHPARGSWSFPAGYVNRGEVLEEAAVREVREELNVDVRLTGLVGAYSTEGEAVVLVVYGGEVVAGTARPDGREVSDTAWFPLDALPSLAFPHDARIVADWIARQGADRPSTGLSAGRGPADASSLA